jgi:hypothetical protein
VARAAYFPTITLSGAAGYQSTSVQNLFSGPGLVWSVGATLAQTLFDGGLRKAVTEQSRAIYQGTVANYRQTVLTAFQEVEDNLSTLRILSQELQQQNAAVESSQRYLTLANAPATNPAGHLPQCDHRANRAVEQSADGAEPPDGTTDGERPVDQSAGWRLGCFA